MFVILAKEAAAAIGLFDSERQARAYCRKYGLHPRIVRVTPSQEAPYFFNLKEKS